MGPNSLIVVYVDPLGNLHKSCNGRGYKLGNVGGGQNYGPFLGTLSIRCRIIIGIQKGTIILTTTHVLLLKSPDIHIWMEQILHSPATCKS